LLEILILSDAPHLLVEEDGPILIATLNRPEKLNAITGKMMALYEQALHRFRDTAELKVMLVRATGRYFCAGADLRDGGGKQFRTASAIRENHRLNLNGMHRIYDEMEHIEKPIVVAHHAMCVGGGLELSLSCDFRLAAKSAGYAFPEGLFGVLPASNGVSRLTRICGPHWARWLIMANKPADAEMARTMGLVHQVFPDGEQMGAAKVAIELCTDVGRDQGRNVERMANSALMLNPDYLARIERYVAGIGGSGKKD
jgi:enoyl-CoA hydratase/carnithine racemase